MADPVPSVNLRDKIGQMLLIGFEGKKINAQSPIVKMIVKNNIGGVILYDYNRRTKSYDKNIENPQQLKQLNQDLQYFTRLGNIKHHRPQLPLLIALDYEGGNVTRLNKRNGFPTVLSAAEVGKRGLKQAEFTAESMAQVLKKAGFNMNFAPVLDVNINPASPVIGKKNRSFSNDPLKVSRYASVYTRHFLKQGIQCAYKHFPGHGSADKDSHKEFVDVTNNWQRYELQPYQQVLDLNMPCGAIMTAHIINRRLDASGLPATLSYKILTEVLRKQLQFKGVIITDDMQMKAIRNHYELGRALELSINAGADMLMFGNNTENEPQNPSQLIDLIEAKVKSGQISAQRINQAYERILKFKQFIAVHGKNPVRAPGIAG